MNKFIEVGEEIFAESKRAGRFQTGPNAENRGLLQ